jgi:thymidylate synthase ThyX
VIEAKVIEKSINPKGHVLTTLQLRYPRFIHSEFMTHRVFSRNASSSRAIPVRKILDQIASEPAEPVHWGANQSGMQAHVELEQPERVRVQSLWREAAISACEFADRMAALGAHKQIVNRITEPFAHISVIVTATEWGNFCALRNHPDAQPEIRALAQAMLTVDAQARPTLRTDEFDGVYAKGWHLPYVTAEEREIHADNSTLLCKLSAARCARVSYLTHDGLVPDQQKDLELFERLVGSQPLHASPIEHQGYAWVDDSGRSRNFVGWTQFREVYEDALIA